MADILSFKKKLYDMQVIFCADCTYQCGLQFIAHFSVVMKILIKLNDQKDLQNFTDSKHDFVCDFHRLRPSMLDNDKLELSNLAEDWTVC